MKTPGSEDACVGKVNRVFGQREAGGKLELKPEMDNVMKCKLERE